MIKVASAPLEADLSQFSRWMTGQGLPHRIVEQGGEQAIFLATDEYKEQVEAALALYLQDQNFKDRVDNTQPIWRVSKAVGNVQYPRANPAQAPVIFSFIVISALVAWLTAFGQGGWLLRALLIVDPFLVSVDLNSWSGRLQGLVDILSQGQLWRLISPDFIHFNIMHIVFNLLMLWVLGGQLEIRKGSAAFVNLAIFVSLISNVAQLLDSGYLFGGLSGVVYGLIGYCWILKKTDPTIFLPDVIFRFSIVWLLLGYTPLTESLGWGRMANSAHLYGLLSGIVWGIISVRMSGKKNPQGQQ